MKVKLSHIENVVSYSAEETYERFLHVNINTVKPDPIYEGKKLINTELSPETYINFPAQSSETARKLYEYCFTPLAGTPITEPLYVYSMFSKEEIMAELPLRKKEACPIERYRSEIGNYVYVGDLFWTAGPGAMPVKATTVDEIHSQGSTPSEKNEHRIWVLFDPDNGNKFTLYFDCVNEIKSQFPNGMFTRDVDGWAFTCTLTDMVASDEKFTVKGKYYPPYLNASVVYRQTINAGALVTVGRHGTEYIWECVDNNAISAYSSHIKTIHPNVDNISKNITGYWVYPTQTVLPKSFSEMGNNYLGGEIGGIDIYNVSGNGWSNSHLYKQDNVFQGSRIEFDIEFSGEALYRLKNGSLTSSTPQNAYIKFGAKPGHEDDKEMYSDYNETSGLFDNEFYFMEVKYSDLVDNKKHIVVYGNASVIRVYIAENETSIGVPDFQLMNTVSNEKVVGLHLVDSEGGMFRTDYAMAKLVGNDYVLETRVNITEANTKFALEEVVLGNYRPVNVKMTSIKVYDVNDIDITNLFMYTGTDFESEDGPVFITKEPVVWNNVYIKIVFTPYDIDSVSPVTYAELDERLGRTGARFIQIQKDPLTNMLIHGTKEFVHDINLINCMGDDYEI